MTAVEPISEDLEKEKTQPSSKSSLPHRAMRRLGKSRYSGLFFGPLYGVLIYLYIAFLIIPGRPFTHTDQDQDFNALITMETGHYIAGGVGIVSGTGLTISSMTSRRLRCTMVLMIPTLVTRRGRALLMALSIGLLVEGPLRTMRYNLFEIGNTFTCMYDEIYKLSSHILHQFGVVLSQFQIILEKIRVLLDLYIKRLEADLSPEGIQELKDARAAIEKIKTAAEKAADAVSVPDTFCSGVISASSPMGSKIKKLSSKFREYVDDLVGGSSQNDRRKRDACAAIVEFGEVNLNNISQKDLEEILTKIGSNVDVTKIKTRDDLVKELDTTSIDYIRTEFKETFESAMDTILIVTIWVSKVLYLTIFLLVHDANTYLTHHYSDDTFDNMMVDDNLKRLNRKKLTPLRNWEIQEQYYHAKDVIMTSNELITMLIISLSSAVCTLSVTIVVIGDYLLSAALIAFTENSKLAISFPGLESGVSVASQEEDTIEIEGYDFSLDPCIPHGRESPPRVLWPLYMVLLLCLLSCTLETYFARARAIICNAFYEKRAEQRAIYLYE